MHTEETNASMPPAFVLSSPRSGSTLLRFIIDTHPDICSPGELRLGPLAHHLYQVHYLTTAQVTSESEAERHQKSLDEARRVICELMGRYALIKKKKMWCEKSPINVNYISRITGVFPEAKFICLYRHCMDVISSILETSRLGFMGHVVNYVHRDPINLVNSLAEGWIDETKRLMELERDMPSQCFRIRYEDLVTDPEGVLEPMFKFLGVEWAAELIDKVFTSAHEKGEGDIKIAYSSRIERSNIGKGASIPLQSIFPDVVEKANAMLEEMGYPAMGSDWGSAPVLPSKTSVNEERLQSPADVNQVFADYFGRRIKERRNLARSIDSKFKFIIRENPDASWMVDLTGEEICVSCEQGDADSTITVSQRDLVDLINGKLNAGGAYMQGKISVAGDLLKAQTLASALFGA